MLKPPSRGITQCLTRPTPSAQLSSECCVKETVGRVLRNDPHQGGEVSRARSLGVHPRNRDRSSKRRKNSSERHGERCFSRPIRSPKRHNLPSLHQKAQRARMGYRAIAGSFQVAHHYHRFSQRGWRDSPQACPRGRLTGHRLIGNQLTSLTSHHTIH